jgi:predicted DNA-binding transcriptional regulator YafY
MNRLMRLFAIVNYLTYNTRTTAKELARQLEVSTRTVYRDIDLLSSMDIPIYIKAGRNGGIYMLDFYTISKSLVSEREQVDLLHAVNLFNALGLSKDQQLKNKISNVFSKKIQANVHIDFSGWGKEGQKEKLELLSECISKRKTAIFDYTDRKSKTTRREVIVTDIEFKKNAWYAKGFCLAKEVPRVFKLQRITNIEIGNDFNTQLYERAQESLKSLFSDMMYMEVELKVAKAQMNRLKEDVEVEIIAEIDDKFQKIKITQPKGDWLVYYLLSFGSAVEVISPKSLREKVINEINTMKNSYLP